MIQYFLLSVYFFIASLLGFNTWSHGMVGQPVSLVPSEVNSDTEKTISSLLFRNLVNVDPKTGNFTYDLIDSYKVKGEGRVYEVKLKENQYWHDGKPITANDLLYTASINSNLKEVSFDKVDDYTVRFVLPNKYSPFLGILAIPLMPAHLADKNSSIHPVGNSDFRVARIKRDRANIKEVILASTNKDHPYKFLKFVFYDDEKDLVLGAKLYEVDSFLYNLNESFEGFNAIKKYFPSRTYLLIFNAEKDEMARDSRANILASLDIVKLVQKSEYELAVIPNGPFSGTWAENTELFSQQVDYKPVKLDLKRPLVLAVPNARPAKLLANEIKKQLEENDVAEITIKEVDYANFASEVRGVDYDMLLMAQEYGIDPDRYIFWHSSQNSQGLNFSNFSSIRTDKSLTEGREELDTEKRKEHYNIFQSVFSEERPAIYIEHPTQFLYFSNRLNSIPESNSFYPWDIFNNYNQWVKNTSQKVL